MARSDGALGLVAAQNAILEERMRAEMEEERAAYEHEAEQSRRHEPADVMSALAGLDLAYDIPITHGAPRTYKRSRFQAHAAPVRSVHDVEHVLGKPSSARAEGRHRQMVVIDRPCALIERLRVAGHHL